ncbi:protein of unknown function [Ralstonia solanacearum CMR15]|nr:protein of unknown function [Ralstonia solanacearum CMR15]
MVRCLCAPLANWLRRVSACAQKKLLTTGVRFSSWSECGVRPKPIHSRAIPRHTREAITGAAY